MTTKIKNDAKNEDDNKKEDGPKNENYPENEDYIKNKKAFDGLGSCDNVQTERSIFEYANWPGLRK